MATSAGRGRPRNGGRATGASIRSTGGTRSSVAEVRTRREQILQHVTAARTLEVKELAELVGVSAGTLYRDLSALSDKGMVRVDRGVVVAPTSMDLQTNATFRLGYDRDRKRTLALAALTEVGRPRSILMDDSTSAIPLVRAIAEAGSDYGTTMLVTNFLGAADELVDLNLEIHLLPGRLEPRLGAVFGPATLAAARRWHTEVAILSAPAINDGQMMHLLAESDAIKAAMAEQAERVVLLADSSKFGRTAPHLTFAADRVDLLVTDTGVAAEQLAPFHAAGTTVLLVDPDDEDGRARARRKPTQQKEAR